MLSSRLFETIRRTTVPHDVSVTATSARISVQEIPPINPFPTHLLVIEQHPPVKGQRHRTLLPIHDIVVLSFLSRVNLPPRMEPDPVQVGDKIEITVPIARLAIPNPRTFDKILSHIYSALKQNDIMNFFDKHLGYAGLPEHARVEAATSLPKLLRLPFLKPEERLTWGDWSKQTEGRLGAQVRFPPMLVCWWLILSTAFHDLLL